MVFRSEPEPQLAFFAVGTGIAALLLIGFLAWPIFASGSVSNWVDGLRAGGLVLSGWLCGLLIRKLHSKWKRSRMQSDGEKI